MTIKLTNPLAILAKDPNSFLLHAEPKVGKTYLAGTMPGSHFISCPGDEALTLAALPGANIDRIYQCEDWVDFCKCLLNLAERPKKEDFQTLVVDTWTFAYGWAVEAVTKEQKRPEIVSQATWTEANRKCLNVLDNAKRLCYPTGKNFVAIAHSRVINKGDDLNPDWKTKADLGDSLRSKFYGRFSSIFHLRMIGNDKRELLMRPTPGIDVGSRLKFEKNLTNPTGEAILEMIREYKEKREKENG